MILQMKWLSTALVLVLITPLAQGTATGLPLADFANLIVQGGLGGALLWVWWKTFQQSAEEQKLMREEIAGAISKAVEKATSTARVNAERHDRREKEMMQMIRADHDLKTQLAGILSRLETKIDNLPTQSNPST